MCVVSETPEEGHVSLHVRDACTESQGGTESEGGKESVELVPTFTTLTYSLGVPFLQVPSLPVFLSVPFTPFSVSEICIFSL